MGCNNIRDGPGTVSSRSVSDFARVTAGLDADSASALSRSGKKVLHVDKNPYYGGPEAAFSLQEAEEWVTRISNGEFVRPTFFAFS